VGTLSGDFRNESGPEIAMGEWITVQEVTSVPTPQPPVKTKKLKKFKHPNVDHGRCIACGRAHIDCECDDDGDI
jgi:hypothetical protein